jgi:hypothetical protein
MHARVHHIPVPRLLLTGAAAAIACLLLSNLTFHVAVARIPHDFIGDPLLFVARLFVDHLHRASLIYALVTSVCEAFSPYMLGQTLLVGAVVGILFPRLVRPDRSLSRSLGLAAALGLVGVMAVAAVAAVSLAFRLQFGQPETRTAVQLAFVHHLRFTVPWALLISVLFAARLHRRAA